LVFQAFVIQGLAGDDVAEFVVAFVIRRSGVCLPESREISVAVSRIGGFFADAELLCDEVPVFYCQRIFIRMK
jgi:hypothetical protein